MVLPYPYKVYDNVTQIIPTDIQAMGVKGVLLDIDGTLMRTKDKAPDPRVMEWIDSLKQNDIAVYVLSNNKHPDRVRKLAESIGADWTYLAHKPKKEGFYSEVCKGVICGFGKHSYTAAIYALKCSK